MMKRVLTSIAFLMIVTPNAFAARNCTPEELGKDLTRNIATVPPAAAVDEDNSWRDDPDFKAEQVRARLMRAGLIPFLDSVTGEEMHEGMMDYFIMGRYTNSHLRHEAGQRLSAEEIEKIQENRASIQTMTRRLDAFFAANGPHEGETLTLYRGEGEAGVERRFEVGQRVPFPNYMSLTKNPGLSESFANAGSTPNQKVYYTVRVPGFISAVDLHLMLGNDKHEGTEILLPRGLELRVDQAHLSVRGWEVTATVIKSQKP